MSVELPIEKRLSDAVRAATDDINRWRGCCIEQFARIEETAISGLFALAADGKDSDIRTPTMFGARLQALRDSLSGERPYAGVGRDVIKALDRLDRLKDKRNILVHGMGTVWIDGSGRWLWRYCFTPPGKARTPEEGVIACAEAIEMEGALKSIARSFRDRVVNLTRSFRSAEPLPK